MRERRSLTRRRFLNCVLGTAASTALAGRPARAAGAVPAMPTRPLGKTGHQVSLFGLGGQAAIEDPARRELAVSIVHRALDLGVNYIDTASLYGGGESERAIGEVMRTRRKEAFLASKTHDRSYDGSMRLLETSLKRLRTDRLDLWQLHNVKTDVDVDFVLSRSGAVRALERAREQGMVRAVGITGHKDPHVLRRAIERYPFDVILMSLNAAEIHGDLRDGSFVRHALPFAAERGMGIVGMKVPSQGALFRNTGVRTMEQAMRYVLTLPVSAVIIGISALAELEENVRIARSFAPYTPEQMAEIERLTQPYFAEAIWYRDH